MANPTWDDTEEIDSSATAPSWDNTEEVAPEKSFMDQEVPLTPFFDPTVRDVIDNPVTQTIDDTAVGAVQGATLGAADEIGGGISALLEKGLGYIPGTGAHKTKEANAKLGIPDESFGETYRGYQKSSEKAFKDAGDRSPVFNTLGNIGGSVATGIGVGGLLGIGNTAKGTKSVYDIYQNQGKMKALMELGKRGGTSALKATPAMAVESALVSEGNFDNEQTREKLGEDVLSGVAFGIPTMLGLNGITEIAAPAAKAGLNAVDEKFGNFVKDNPFMRKYGIGVKYGENGIKPTTEAGLNMLEGQQIDRTKGMLDNVYTADKTLGKAVGKSIEDATTSGTRLDINKPVTKALTALNFSYNTFQDMAESARGRHIFEKIQKNMGGDVSPAEAKGLLDDVDAFIGKFNASKHRTTAEEATLSTLNKVRKELSDQMKKDIPAYGAAAERFTEFRRLVPETILSKERPAEITDIFMGNLRNSDQKLYDSLNDLQLGATSQGSGSSNIRKAFGNAQVGMKEFEANEATRNAALQAQGLAPNVNPLVQSADEFTNQTKQFSDEANFLKDVQTVKSPFVTGQNLVSTVGQLGHSGALSTSLLVGRAKKPLVNLGRKAYNMPAEKLSALAAEMKASPKLKILGQALEDGLANGDQAKKNAAIFSILQNPEASLYFSNDEEDN
jgi:hypothetical protein